jgi:hypothetical protein
MSEETTTPEWFFSDPEKAAELVAEARSWFGTRFHFYSRMKGAGVDCVGFCEEVTAAIGLERWAFDRKPDDYSRHVERNTIVKLLRGQEHHPAAAILAARWHEFEVNDHAFTEPPMVGDLVLYRDGNERLGVGVFHMGLMTNDKIFMQCAPRLNVCEAQIDDPTYGDHLFAHFRARAEPSFKPPADPPPIGGHSTGT